MIQNLNGRPPVAMQLLKFQQANRMYLQILRDIRPDLEALGFEGQLLRELCQAAQRNTEWGTPASIVMATAELLGES
jgi:hypothetical protein